MSNTDQLLRACISHLYNETNKENIEPVSSPTETTPVKQKKERKPYVQTEARKQAFLKCQQANRERRERLKLEKQEKVQQTDIQV